MLMEFLFVDFSLVCLTIAVQGLVEPLVRYNEHRAADMEFSLKENEQIM
jgi:hypothetical protein